ncbi:MAG: cytidine deaminase [Clostridia bacterium]|nr:cytidine deaminase [Clostridia bacterium]
MDYKELMEKAEKAREFSYAPYSHFNVGAALLAKNGKVFTGCNIENATFTPTVCAERTAFFKAISEGVSKFEALAISGGKEGEPPSFCAPCGVCRQVMAEFCDENFKLVLGTKENFGVYGLNDILPFAFTKKELK